MLRYLRARGLREDGLAGGEREQPATAPLDLLLSGSPRGWGLPGAQPSQHHALPGSAPADLQTLTGLSLDRADLDSNGSFQGCKSQLESFVSQQLVIIVGMCLGASAADIVVLSVIAFFWSNITS